MYRKVYLDFQDGNGYRDISSYVKYDTLNISIRGYSDNFHYAQNECSFDIIYDSVIYPLLRYATNDILCKIVDVYDESLITTEDDYFLTTEDGFYLAREIGGFIPWFYGRISPTKSRSYNGILNNTIWSITAEDDTQQLNKAVGDICYTNFSIMNPNDSSTSIVHQLAYIAGFTLPQIGTVVIPTVIEKFAPNDEDDSILDILDTLLFEYGYTLNFGVDGILTPLKWINEESSTFDFTENNMLREVVVEDSVKEYHGAELTWYEVAQAVTTSGSTDILLYRDDNCGYDDDGTFTGYLIPSGYLYPPACNAIDTTTSGTSTVYQEYTTDAVSYWTNYAITHKLDYNYKAFDSDFSGIVATSGWWVDYSVDTGIMMTVSGFGNKKARIVYSNPTGSGLYIYYNNIYGNVWYKSAERVLTVDHITVSGQNLDEYVSTWIFNGTTASGFVQALAAQYDLGSMFYTVISEEIVYVGDIVNITMNDGTDQDCLVVEKSWDEKEQIYTYKCRAHSADTGTITNQYIGTGTKLAVQETISSQIYPTNTSVSANIDGSNPDLINAYTDFYIYLGQNNVTYDWTYSAVTVGVTGSFGTGGYKNRYTVSGFDSNATKHGTVTITASRNGFSPQVYTYTVDKIYQSDAASTVDVNTISSGLQTQIDNKIEAFYQETPDPADSWTTDVLKQYHNDDQWYLTTSKIWKRYRYVTTNSGVWDLLQESDALTALANAATASGIAVSKNTIWVSQSVAESNGAVVNDIYTISGMMYKCTVQSPYTWVRFNAIRFADGTTDPTGVVAGDYYYNTSTSSYRIYNGSSWEDDASIASVTTYTPHYYGKYLDTTPTGSFVTDDVYCRYSTTSGTANRGVFKHTVSGWGRTEENKYVNQALTDISFLIAYKDSSGVTIYGTAADYTGDSTVQANFAFFQSAMVGFLEANNIKLTASGSIYGGERYNADGSDNDTSASGYWQGANGVWKSDKGIINAATVSGTTIYGGSVIGSTISGLNGYFGNVKIGISGSLYGGDRYTASGTVADGTKDGFYLGADGKGKISSLSFEGTQGNGVMWVSCGMLGTGLNITAVGYSAITALNGTDIAFINGYDSQLRTYRWNGSTWSLVGTGLNISSFSTPAMTTLNGTDIILVRCTSGTNSYFGTYRWNGSTWSLVGTEYNLGDIGGPAITALNGTDIAFIDGNNDQLRTYRWNGSTWSLVSTIGSPLIGGRSPAITALNGTDIAFIDDINDQLRTYHYYYALSKPWKYPFTGE